MNIAAAITIASSLLCLYAFVLCSRLSRAPGWQDQGWFALIALSGSAFVALDIINSIAASDGAVLSFGRFQVFVGGINSAAWLIYTQRTLNGPAVSLASKVCAAVLIGIGCSALSPGLFTDQKVLEFYSSLLHVTYRVPAFTDYGNGVIALLTLVLLVSAARFGRAWWRKVPGARAHFLGLTALTLCVVNDFLMSLDVLKTPLLIDVGYTIAICGSALALTGRFVQDARALEAFSAGLERTVETRTRELFGAHEELHRAEKLAGVGQLAAGLAHEINNPAGVIKSNLDYLAGALGTDEPLAGGIAHDLNNTLAPILMTVGLLREQEKDPSRRDDLETIEVCSQRAAEMVGQLLNFARGVDGRRVRTRVGQITSEVQKIIRDSFPKDVVLNVTLPNDQWELNADPTQLHQLLMNLAVNARDAMPHGGVITLAVEHVILDEVYAGMNLEAKPGPYVLLRIEDTGVGMPREIVERIFDPFFTTKEVGKGTGLGLSTAHSIVRGHGGFIHVYSEVGKGTRFHVYLPADVEASAAEEVAIEQSSMPRGKGELVLVVDDEEIIRSVAKRTLERFGYRVMLANHGAEAVSQYAQHGKEIDVVLTDMSMPVMDGPATIVALRSLNPRVKIIGSSGLNANGNVAKAVGAGVQHFVPKPYTADVMLRVLRKILTEG